MAAPIHIETEGLSHEFVVKSHSLRVLANVNLSVAEGEFVSIIGPSGCGKTTLLRIIGGLLSPTRGSVRIAGGDPSIAQRRKAIGYVFQDPSLLPWRTVRDNVRLPLQIGGGTGSEGSVDQLVAHLVAMVGLADFAGYYPHELSGGMKQRAALARALALDPALLLMDEPLGSLDELTRAMMRYELLRIWQQRRKTVVMVTHGIAEAVAMSDRVVVMRGLPGRIVGTVRIDLPRPRHASIGRTPAFLDLTDEVQRLLGIGETVEATLA